MTAYLKEGNRPEIPRVITKRPSISGPTVSLVQSDLRYYSKGNRQIRYQHLPDRDPNEDDDAIIKKLHDRFEYLGEFARRATTGSIRALIVSGPGGVGKTFMIDKSLEAYDPSGEKYSTHSGYSTPVGLLKMLYKNREEGSLLKLDDIDSVFNDEKALNLIKTACDTTRERIVTYATNAILEDEEGNTLPNTFPFNGTVIFSTNLDFDTLIDAGSKLSRHFEALMTRSHYIDLQMRTKRDYLMRIYMVADESNLFGQVQGGPLTRQEEDDVLKFIDDHHKVLRECSLRMALKIGALRKGASDKDKFSWEQLAKMSCCIGVR